jgi:hypothetical protein
VKAGNLNVALSPTSPEARSIPGKGIVPFASYRMTAGSNDITLRGVTVTRKGLGNRNEITRVYFEVNGVRVSARQTIGVDEKALISISPALVIKAGSSIDLDLVAILSGSNNGGQHFFSIDGVESIDSSAAQVV